MVVRGLTNAISRTATALCFFISIAVVLGYIFFTIQNYRGPSPIYFCILLLATAYSKKLGLCLLVFLLPISPALHTQLSFIHQPAVPFFIAHPGIDICVGFITGVMLLNVAGYRKLLRPEDNIPWPIGLTLIIILISAVVAVWRNIFQQEIDFDILRLIEKILLFKTVVRGDPYFPAVDIFTYAVCASLIGILKNSFRNDKNLENNVIITLACSLYLCASWGLIQTITKFGLPEITYNHRVTTFFHGAQGFQPDLHAFGALMLLGSIGLLGYYYYAASSREKKFLFGVIVFCWIALVLSKSRAAIVFSCIAAGILIFFAFRRYVGKELFIRFLWVNAGLMLAIPLIPLMLTSSTVQNLYPTEHLDFSLWNQMLSLRPELHRAALRMFSDFPWFGVGQGNFLNFSISKVHNYTNYNNWPTGENAHNYFLQTLAEIGVVGFGSFIILFAYPILHNRRLQTAIPVYILVISIFWGNLYSHSLIVRENLFILAVAVAVMYSNIRTYR